MFSRPLLNIIWREYLRPASFFTLTGCIWLVTTGLAGIPYFFWYKTVGSLFIVTYLVLYRKKYLYIFYNLGFGKRHVLAISLAGDMVMSVCFSLLSLFLKPQWESLLL